MKQDLCRANGVVRLHARVVVHKTNHTLGQHYDWVAIDHDFAAKDFQARTRRCYGRQDCFKVEDYSGII